jgi:hypothetical protein
MASAQDATTIMQLRTVKERMAEQTRTSAFFSNSLWSQDRDRYCS